MKLIERMPIEPKKGIRYTFKNSENENFSISIFEMYLNVWTIRIKTIKKTFGLFDFAPTINENLITEAT